MLNKLPHWVLIAGITFSGVSSVARAEDPFRPNGGRPVPQKIVEQELNEAYVQAISGSARVAVARHLDYIYSKRPYQIQVHRYMYDSGLVGALKKNKSEYSLTRTKDLIDLSGLNIDGMNITVQEKDRLIQTMNALRPEHIEIVDKLILLELQELKGNKQLARVADFDTVARVVAAGYWEDFVIFVRNKYYSYDFYNDKTGRREWRYSFLGSRLNLEERNAFRIRHIGGAVESLDAAIRKMKDTKYDEVYVKGPVPDFDRDGQPRFDRSGQQIMKNGGYLPIGHPFLDFHSSVIEGKGEIKGQRPQSGQGGPVFPEAMPKAAPVVPNGNGGGSMPYMPPAVPFTPKLDPLSPPGAPSFPGLPVVPQGNGQVPGENALPFPNKVPSTVVPPSFGTVPGTGAPDRNQPPKKGGIPVQPAPGIVPPPATGDLPPASNSTSNKKPVTSTSSYYRR